ncbi:unnamed protein product [Bursaphelenchus xylophilus]|uniref:(pine wood nematode) hypothetical protein n=1 Tax=Bursaphelenchus xylophilus TaxID=6326 RepID=A0A1I7RZ75_BURXY|nr:unnamed protein product [Bursaphelenchus xylophilus]CAG9106775.1 unnamed protein product [Bursaphelenchus xylophilus]
MRAQEAASSSLVYDRNRVRTEDSLQKQRERANKRERDRTRALNAAYTRLRQKIPSLPSDKTSKIHTLRVTVEYIQFLRELASENNTLNVDLAVNENNQINIPATFNSWRTGINQRKAMNAVMKCPGPSTSKACENLQDRLPPPAPSIPMNPLEFPQTSGAPQIFWPSQDYCLIPYSNPSESSPSQSSVSSLGSALGHAINHSGHLN